MQWLNAQTAEPAACVLVSGIIIVIGDDPEHPLGAQILQQGGPRNQARRRISTQHPTCWQVLPLTRQEWTSKSRHLERKCRRVARMRRVAIRSREWLDRWGASASVR